MAKTPKQLDAEIEEALELSAYALHVRNEEAAALRRSGYQKLATGIARGASYEIYGDKTGSYTVLRSKDLSELATAYVADDGRQNYLTSVSINDPKYKRLGIGTALYNAIEKHRGQKLAPSPTHQSDEAKAFWSRRTGKAGGQLRHHSTITKASPRSKKRGPRLRWIPDEDAYEVARDFAFNWTTGGAIKQARIPAISIRSSPIEDVPAFNSLVKALGDPTTARKVPPLVVERAGTGTDYRIVDGRHRLAAANKHGFARVPVIIVEGGG